MVFVRTSLRSGIVYAEAGGGKLIPPKRKWTSTTVERISTSASTEVIVAWSSHSIGVFSRAFNNQHIHWDLSCFESKA